MKLLSLYSGVGGMDYGAHMAGIETVAFCEADPWNRSILNRHWPGVPSFESDEQITADSLRALGIDRIDIVAGGPPCQPFSVAGKREGTTDPRHRWPEMARIVGELRPTFVVVENVAGFNDVAEQLVRADLESLGYRTVRFDIPAAAVGAPHQRDRIFVVAYTGNEPGGAKPEQQHGEWPGELGRCGALAMADADELGRECIRGGGVLDRVGAPFRHDADGCGGETSMADGDGTGRGERCGSVAMGEEQRPAERGGEAALEHAGESRWAWCPERRLLHLIPAEGRRAWSPEPRLGGDLGWVADRLDAVLWPAARGAAQHEWEPARVTTERHERRKRLKALGNICSPVQVLPLFAVIMAVWQELGAAVSAPAQESPSASVPHP